MQDSVFYQKEDSRNGSQEYCDLDLFSDLNPSASQTIHVNSASQFESEKQSSGYFKQLSHSQDPFCPYGDNSLIEALDRQMKVAKEIDKQSRNPKKTKQVKKQVKPVTLAEAKKKTGKNYLQFYAHLVYEYLADSEIKVSEQDRRLLENLKDFPTKINFNKLFQSAGYKRNLAEFFDPIKMSKKVLLSRARDHLTKLVLIEYGNTLRLNFTNTRSMLSSTTTQINTTSQHSL